MTTSERTTAAASVRLGALVESLGDALGLLAPLAPSAADVAVADVVCDSRQARRGCLFVAVAGGQTDGARFAASAVAAGAVAVVVGEAAAAGLSLDVPVLVVASPRRALGLLASRVHGDPSATLRVLAVTGTNGKSTTAIVAAQLLCAAGIRAAALGTLGLWTPEGLQPGGLTTPDAADLQRTFARLHGRGFEAVLIEASSHALDQERLVGTRLHAIAWTNLTMDHLDYHGDMASYCAAKRRLFEEFGVPAGRAFANVDDVAVAAVVDDGLATGWSFAGDARAAWHVAGLTVARAGLALQLCRPGLAPLRLAVPLHGRHNAENLVAAVSLVQTLGVTDADIVAACASLRAPAGRLEAVDNDLGALVLVDYAHTPDALDHVLDVARELVDEGGKLVVVFGCGGDRDRGKRPLMGAVAARRADLVLVTSDNPRSEPPLAIAEAALDGALQAGAQQLQTLVPSTLGQLGTTPGALLDVDRDAAIRRAVGVLAAGDVLVVAGKGHETTQTIGTEVLPFSDVEVLRRWLALRSCNGARRGEAPVATTPGPHCGASVARPLWSDVEATAATLGTLSVAGTRVGDGVGTDSRAVAPGSIFLALSGERFDGHAFVEGALRAGAAGVVVASGRGAAFEATARELGAFVIEVPDTLVALGDLARSWRRIQPATVVGITGSNGKTSTKELTALCLAAFGPTLATHANHNNRVGVPQTLFRLRQEHRFAVVEMGMSEPGEIAELARIAEPTIGLVTSIGEAHLERLGSIEAIAEEKAALLRALPAHGVAIAPAGVAVLEPELRSVRARIVRFGADPSAEVRLVGAIDVAGDVQHFEADVLGKRVRVELPALGRHMVDNALAALALAAVLGDNLEAAARQIANYQPVGQRMRPLRLGERLVLEDCYNANPTSVEAALRTLATCQRPRVAVLGEMRELGPASESLHRRVAQAAGETELLVAIGPHAEAMVAAAAERGIQARAFAADDIEAAAAVALHGAGRHATILVKGSRGARLERVIEAMKQLTGGATSAGPGHAPHAAATLHVRTHAAGEV